MSSCKGMLYSNKINKCKHQKATSETGTEKAERPQSTYWCIWFLKNCNYEFLLYSKIGKFVDCESAYPECIGPSVSVGSGDICGKSLGSPIRQKRDGCSVKCWGQEEQLACLAEIWKK